MKKLFYLFPLFASLCLAQGFGGKAGMGGKAGFGGGASGGAVTWTLVHDTQTDSATGTCTQPSTTCTITIPSTTAGNILVGYIYNASNLSISTVTGDGTWTHCSNCAVSNATVAAGIDMAYRAVATGGATSIVFTFSGTASSFTIVEVSEWHRSTGSATFDTSNNVNDSTNCTACNGVTLTLSGSNDLIVSAFTLSQTLTSINSPYIISALPEQLLVYWLGATAGTAPVANQTPTGQMIFAAVAFK